VTNTAGGTAVDLNKTVVSYTDNNDFITKEYGTGDQGWTYLPVVFESGHDDNLLESGEKYKVTINLTTGTNTGASAPGPNEKIKIEIKPPEGAVLSIQKTMPPALAANKYYTVY
jgi:flagellin FlaB